MRRASRLPCEIASEGANESYDAADYQNMALATIVYNRGTNVSSPWFVDPSFHRMELIEFWFDYVSKTWLSGVAPPAACIADFPAALRGEQRAGVRRRRPRHTHDGEAEHRDAESPHHDASHVGDESQFHGQQSRVLPVR